MHKHSFIKVLLFITTIIGIILLYNIYSQLNNAGEKSELISKYEISYRIGLDDGDFPPLIVYGDEILPTGFDIDMIHWIEDAMELNFILIPMAWGGIFAALEAKEIDMIVSGVSITPERMEKYFFSVPYLSISQSIAINAEGTMFLDDFYAGRGIVGVKAKTTSDALVREILLDTGILPEENLRTFSDIETGAQELANGNIDYLLSDWPVMVALIQRFPIHIIGDIDTGEKYGIVMHKDNKKLQQTINQGLEKLLNSYEFDSMKHKYLLDY